MYPTSLNLLLAHPLGWTRSRMATIMDHQVCYMTLFMLFCFLISLLASFFGHAKNTTFTDSQINMSITNMQARSTGA